MKKTNTWNARVQKEYPHSFDPLSDTLFGKSNYLDCFENKEMR